MRRFVHALLFAVLVSGIAAACGGTNDPQPTAASGNVAQVSQTTATSETSGNTSDYGGQTKVEKQWSSPPAMQLEQGKDYQAVLHTSKGDMTVDLFEAESPITVNNFVFLAQQGFYTNVPFHRIIKGFMIQTGDPTGTGTGSPGYRFNDEKVTREYLRGTLAMANSGRNTNGSQFFVMHEDYPLQKNYTIFGIVTDGFDTLDAIANTPVHANPRGGGEQSVPDEPVTLESVDIITK
jgi:cyclophilin family peptidyl-prolyl cis-trans isomerase